MAIVVTEKERKLGINLAIVVAICIGSVYGSDYYVEQDTSVQRSLNNDLKAEEAEYRKRLSEIQDEERLQNQYVESYLAYKERGLIVGEEAGDAKSATAIKREEAQRLGLLERLQQIQEDRKFFPVETSLTRPENLPSSFSQFTEESNVAVRTNQMEIKFEMLHGLDMLMLLGDFYDANTNRFVPVSCKIQRLKGQETQEGANAEALLRSEPKLDATCNLVWLTVFDPLQDKATAGGQTEQPES